MTAFVYFLASDQGFLKIGCSKNPVLRFSGHRSQLAPRIGKLTFLGAIEGTIKDELLALNSFPSIKFLPYRLEIRKLPDDFSIATLFPGRRIFSLEDLRRMEQRKANRRNSLPIMVKINPNLLSAVRKFTNSNGMWLNPFMEEAVRRELKRRKDCLAEAACRGRFSRPINPPVAQNEAEIK